MILTRNFVNYKGCVEKDELKERLRQLFRSNRELETRQQRMNSSSPVNLDETKDKSDEKQDENECKTATTSGGGLLNHHNDDDLCKICMDRLIDCVLVECGHMCSCVKCGKLLSERPICRQYVVRVIRVFKS